MKSMRKLLIGSLALTCATASFAQGMDLAEALRLARSANAGLQKLAAELSQAERNAASAWNGLLPSLGVQAGLSNKNNETWSASAGASLSVEISAQTPFRIDQAGIEHEIAILSYQRGLAQVERDVSKAFYNQLVLEAKVRVFEKTLATAAARHRRSAEEYERGLVSELSLLSSEQNLRGLEASLAGAELDARAGWRDFLLMLGLGSYEGGLSGTINVPELREAVSLDVAAREDISKLAREVERQEALRGLSAAQGYAPRLSFSYSYSLNVADLSRRSDPVDATSLSLSLNLPLDGWLPFSSAAVSLANADDAVRSARRLLQEGILSAESELAAALDRVETGRKLLDIRRRGVEIARRNYEANMRHYEVGAVDLLTVEEAEDDLLEAELEELTAIYNLTAALLDLRYASGRSDLLALDGN